MPFEPFQHAGGTRKRFLIGSLLIVALVATATIAAVLLEVGHIKSYFPRPTIGAPAIKEITPVAAGAPETILIIGSDKRALSTSRLDRASPPHSDTMILIRLDPNQHQTSVLSVPRDLKTQFTTDTGRPHIDKINAAYTMGGSALTAATIKATLPGVEINHIIDINFKGFRKVIDAIGCVYIFVDRHYYNQNLGTVATNFSNIDIPPGYQRLCGQTALDYARYRHTDSDYLRVARQQDFIRQAKQQVGVQKLFDNQDKLLQALQHAVQTDIHGSAVLHLINLTLFSLGRPLRQVPFQSTIGPSYVTATPEQIAATVNDFLYTDPGPVHVRLKRPRRGAPAPGLGLSPTPASDIGLANAASVGLPIKLYAPRQRVGGIGTPDIVRAYTLRDEKNVKHRAYVISISRGLVGEYYGVEGTNWMNPPILVGQHQTRKIAGRSYDLYVDGGHIRLVAWRTANAVYWLSNTLRDSLTNQQMLAVVQTARPVN
ncbi:MAG: polyisoprenyl-teichoic acid--peptidoglycan teichoic acid transferase [Solirubrobacteraceae bacterium]|jgi:LCP family protein required for cell wall assembly|nr:polyisoprenyl-teichoic acid--peptidoglycan teichoic acid transferase [Solirubrobacteraceae bacterium]